MTSRTQTVLVVLGTRPEAIKLAPVISALQSDAARFRTRVCVTAQHRGLLDQMLDTFGITPDYDLDLMQGEQSPLQVTCRCLERLTPVLTKEQPEWLLVQGDTTTSFAAALAAFYLKIRVAHVEAGLRTGNKSIPFPEEMNRLLTARIADLHFAPTRRASENLIREGIPEQRIHITGNTGIDAVLWARDRSTGSGQPIAGLEGLHQNRRLILVTGHRRENFGTGIQQICEALRCIALRDDVDIVYSVHLNPNVQRPVKKILGSLPNVFLIDPPDYLSFVRLMDRAYLILSDSGGVQEEAPSLGKPLLVMRDATERPEGVEAGTAKLVGVDGGKIVRETLRLLDDAAEHARMSRIHHPYGDGHASERIVRILASQVAQDGPVLVLSGN